MSLDSIRLSDSEKMQIIKNDKLRQNATAEVEAYDTFTEEGKPYFFDTIDAIQDLLLKEIMNGNIYINTTVISRIKDRESAVNNDDLQNMNKHMLMKIIADQMNEDDYTIETLEQDFIEKEKILDDVFGMTIIVSTDKEKEKVEKIIEKNMKIAGRKNMKKEGYNAIHLKIFKEDDERYPLVECQIKTVKEDMEASEHTTYKVESIIERMLRQEKKLDNPQKKVKIKLTKRGKEKVYSIVQQYYDDNLFTSVSNIPKMWESRFNETNEKMERRLLTEGQILKRMYKFLDMNPKRIKGECK